MKTKGTIPSPRSGHAGVLVGDKWYIAGGETRDSGEFIGIMILIFPNHFFGAVLSFIFSWITSVII